MNFDTVHLYAIGKWRRIYEILFSLYVAFWVVSASFLHSPLAAKPFIDLERTLNAFFDVRQTDFIRGYLSVAIPSILLAFCFWILLNLLAKVKRYKNLLATTGVFVIAGPATFWIYLTSRDSWSWSWLYMAWPIQLITALTIGLFFLKRPELFPRSFGATLIAAHSAYWFWISNSVQLPNFAGPAAAVLGCAALLAWGAYTKVVRLESQEPGLSR